MFIVRDIMYCRPGQVRPMVQKFLALSKLVQKLGFGPMRIMTDVSAERYWTVVAEIEVPNLEEYAQKMDVTTARAAGFDEHLAKPTSIEKVNRIVAGLRPPA